MPGDYAEGINAAEQIGSVAQVAVVRVPPCDERGPEQP